MLFMPPDHRAEQHLFLGNGAKPRTIHSKPNENCTAGKLPHTEFVQSQERAGNVRAREIISASKYSVHTQNNPCERKKKGSQMQMHSYAKVLCFCQRKHAIKCDAYYTSNCSKSLRIHYPSTSALR